MNTKKYQLYFIADVHLGVPDYKSSLEREKKLVAWLDSIKNNATDIFLLGDIFDMWFDFKRVVPKGFVRTLGKFAELSDMGINFHYFIGNHDMWVFNYFKEELNFKIYRNPAKFVFDDKIFFVGHGDGLGDGDNSYKFIKKIFSSKLNQWLFARLHPNFSLGIANYFSKKSRIANGDFNEYYDQGEENILLNYCKKKLEEEHIDYFIFGHKHIIENHKIGNNSIYINIGEWVRKPHIAHYNGKVLELISIDKTL